MSSGNGRPPRRRYDRTTAPALEADVATILAQFRAGINPLEDPENFRETKRKGYSVRDCRDPRRSNHREPYRR